MNLKWIALVHSSFLNNYYPEVYYYNFLPINYCLQFHQNHFLAINLLLLHFLDLYFLFNFVNSNHIMEFHRH